MVSGTVVSGTVVSGTVVSGTVVTLTVGSVVGSVLGAALGAALGIDTTGVDFAMTALFIVIAVGQWRAAGSHFPALLGGGATLLSLLVVGAEDMLLPALGIIVAVLTLMRSRQVEEQIKQNEKEVRA